MSNKNYGKGHGEDIGRDIFDHCYVFFYENLCHIMVSVRTQHVIRQAFGMTGDMMIKNDGSAYSMGDLLASAYFYIEKQYDNNAESGDNLNGIVIHGAGLGHGCGMSQNGAKCLAQRGCTAEEILAYYYNGAIKSVDSLR